MVPRTLPRDPSPSASGLSTKAAALVLGVATGLVMAVGALCWSGDAQARRHEPEASASLSGISSVVALSSLPEQAQDVHRRILVGGPFRYTQDGVVFGNRERALPRQPRGFYREYTVPTPGERSRGARRIVCGGKEVQQPATCFYTEDHYQSFHPIDPRH